MGSAISFCNNKKRHARTHTLQQRIINSQYETELKHPASQSSRKEEDGLKCFKHHQMCNIWSFWVSNLCGTTLHQPSVSTGSRRSTQMAGRARVRTYSSIRWFLLHSARKTEFAFINILTWIWKLFATRVDQRVQHSWSKECWVRKQTKDRWKRQIIGNNDADIFQDFMWTLEWNAPFWGSVLHPLRKQPRISPRTHVAVH